jgi:hypothetical protein
MLLQVAETNLLVDLYKLAPVLAVMAAAIIWLAKQLDKKDTIIAAKESYIQVILTDSITALVKVNSTMDNVMTSAQTSDATLKETIMKEAQQTRESNNQLLIEFKKMLYVHTPRAHHTDNQ